MPRVRCAYPGCRLGRKNSSREAPGTLRLPGLPTGRKNASRNAPGALCLPGLPTGRKNASRKAPGALCLPGLHASMDCAARPGQARIPALAHPHAWASNPQNRTRPGKTRALFVSDKRNKKNRPAARHCATPDDLTSLLASCLPPASCPYGFLVCRPPGDPQSLWRGIHCCRPGIQCLNASPPVEQLGSLPLSWQGPLRPSPRSGRDSVRPSSIRFPSPAPTPRRS